MLEQAIAELEKIEQSVERLSNLQIRQAQRLRLLAASAVTGPTRPALRLIIDELNTFIARLDGNNQSADRP
jgi:hypothetical protein